MEKTNIKHHLTVIKDKCSAPAKLDPSDPATREWVGQVIKLFYLVDDLLAEAAKVSKQSKMMSLFSACNLKQLLQLKQIQKLLLREVAPMKNVKLLPNLDAEEEELAETAVQDYVKEILMQRIFEKNEGGGVRAVVNHGITGMEKGRAATYVCEDEEVKRGFRVVTRIDDVHRHESYADSVVDRVNQELEEKKKKKDSGEGKGFFVVLDDFQNENREEWLKLVEKLKNVAANLPGGGKLLVTTMSAVVVDYISSSYQSANDVFQFDALSFSESRSLFLKIAGTTAS